MPKQRPKAAPKIPEKRPVEIPEDEQIRLIDQSGILNKVPQSASAPRSDWNDDSRPIPLGEEMCNALLYIIPFSFLLLLMEILIHYQYGRNPELKAIVDRMASGVPIISVFIFYTLRYKEHRRMQVFMFIASCLVGSRMVWMINRANWLSNMRQCPPLATAWVYFIVQLDLGPAVLNLVVVYGYLWYKGFKLAM